jgi:beta-glucosidase
MKKMKKMYGTVVLGLLLCSGFGRADAQVAGAAGERIRQLVEQMTNEEKVRMCFGGESFGEVVLPGVERLGIPPMYGADGPRGVRAGAVTVFPAGLGLAASWNPALVEDVGRVIGSESRANGVGVIFGPAFNINRDPLGGRFFEYFTEDPYLNGKLAAAQVRGIQSEGVAACIKHFAVNGRDLNRNEYMSRVDERTLREIYLRGFETAVREADPWSCMTAANGLNDTLCSDSHWLLTDMLRREWGFRGMVLTDFCHSRSTVQAALAGLDVDMPWAAFAEAKFGKPLLEAVERGELPPSVLDEMVRRILWVRWKTGLLAPGDARADAALNTPENQAVARRAAAESIVLLKNEGGVLPLDLNRTKRVVLIGPNCAQRFCVMGLGGSSGAQALYEVTPLKGLEAKLKDRAELTYLPLTGDAGFAVIDPQHWEGGEVRATYQQLGGTGEAVGRTERQIDFSWFTTSPVPEQIKPGYVHATLEGRIKAPVTGNYTLRLSTDDHAEFWVDDMGAQAIRNAEGGVPQRNTAMCHFEAGRTYDIRVIYWQSPDARRNATEMNYWAKDNPSLRLEWALPSDAGTIARTLEPYRQTLADADAVIFVGGTDHNLDCEGRDRTSMNFPQGQTELLRQVSALNPRLVAVLMHGAPIDLPWIDSVPAVVDLFFPGMEGGTAMADVLFGDENPSGRLSFTWPMRLDDSPVYRLATQDFDNVNYQDSLLVGYRYFDTKHVKPRYPFGYGLSYTDFEYSRMKVRRDGDDVLVSLTVTNTGKRDGAETVQLYVGQERCPVFRPVHELKAFRKIFLRAGDRQTVTFRLTADAFAYWNPNLRTWHTDPGRFTIEAARSSADVRLRSTVKL